jgi:hypothetical protein
MGTLAPKAESSRTGLWERSAPAQNRAPAARVRGEKPTIPTRSPRRNQNRKSVANPPPASTGCGDSAAAVRGGEVCNVSSDAVSNGAPQKAQAAVRQVL